MWPRTWLTWTDGRATVSVAGTGRRWRAQTMLRARIGGSGGGRLAKSAMSHQGRGLRGRTDGYRQCRSRAAWRLVISINTDSCQYNVVSPQYSIMEFSPTMMYRCTVFTCSSNTPATYWTNTSSFCSMDLSRATAVWATSTQTDRWRVIGSKFLQSRHPSCHLNNNVRAITGKRSNDPNQRKQPMGLIHSQSTNRRRDAATCGLQRRQETTLLTTLQKRNTRLQMFAQ